MNSGVRGEGERGREKEGERERERGRWAKIKTSLSLFTCKLSDPLDSQLVAMVIAKLNIIM